MLLGNLGVILDTNALSAFADEHPAILSILAGAEQLAIPVIVLGEYRYRIVQSRHKAR
jgi:predicted nucleic acid-binding protein